MKKNSRNEKPRDIKTRIYYFLVFISSLNLSLKKLKKYISWENNNVLDNSSPCFV